MGQTGVINWNEVGDGSDGGSGNQSKAEFMKLSTGGTYRVRPLGSPVVFYKYLFQHEERWVSAICEDPENCPVRQKHNVEPRERYAVNVLDRSDGKLKVMEGPITVFKVFRMFWEGTGNSPGGPLGGDFEIKVTGSGKKTKYFTKLIEKTPFTDEEKTYIQSQKLFDLERIFKATPDNEIEVALFGETQTSEPAQTVAAAAPTTETPAMESSDELPW